MNAMAMPAMMPMMGAMPMGGMSMPMPMPMMNPMMQMAGAMPMMNPMMPMAGAMGMPMMMCKMSYDVTSNGMNCEITPLDPSMRDMLVQYCKQMTMMMGNGMPMIMMCGMMGLCATR
jgi:hypothetical protein